MLKHAQCAIKNYDVLRISLRFEHSVGACTGSLWFVRAIDLYRNRLKKQAIRFPGTVQSELKSAVRLRCACARGIMQKKIIINFFLTIYTTAHYLICITVP